MNKYKIRSLIKELEIAKEELALLNMKIEELLEQLKAELNNGTQESESTIPTTKQNSRILDPVRTPLLDPVMFPNLSKLLRTEVARTHLELSKYGVIQVNTIVDKTNLKPYTTSYGKGRYRGKKGGSFR
jgi:hypothetical protein